MSQMFRSLGLQGGPPRVLKLVAYLLETRVHADEKRLKSGEAESTLTLFDGVKAPSLSIWEYVERIFKYASCSPSCFVVAHIYINRYLQKTGVLLTSFNVHRILVTSVLLAAKFLDDTFFNNAYYAKVGGVSTCELNKLEMKYLFSIGFRVYVDVGTFQEHCIMMCRSSIDGLQFQVEKPIRACRIKESWMAKEDSNKCSGPRIAR